MDHTAFFFDNICLFMPPYKISKKNVISLKGINEVCHLLPPLLNQWINANKFG